MSNLFPSIQFPTSIGISSLPSVQISSLPKTFKGVSFVSNGSSYSGSITGRVVLVLIGGGGGGGGGGSGAGGGGGGNGAVVAVVLPYGSYSLSCTSGTGGAGGTGSNTGTGTPGGSGGGSNCTITETSSNIQFGNITAGGGGGGSGGSTSAGSGGPGGTPRGYVLYAEASIAVNGSSGGSPQSTAQTISSQTQPGLAIAIPSVNGASNTAYGGGGSGATSAVSNGYSGGPGAVFVGVLQ